MEKTKSNRKETHKRPSAPVAVLSLAVIIASIVVSLRLNFGTQMAVFTGAAVAVAVALLLRTDWEEIQKQSMENLANCGIPLVILILVGIMIGVWMIGGTLPSLIYYGLRFISPAAIVPLTFLLCAVTSVFTGTSFGSIATMGLAMYGIGINMGIPGVVIAGAVVSGSYFGDKMSPMSDTTNVAPAMAGTDLYSHISSMMFTTVPATLVTLLLYILIGLRYSGGAYDGTNVTLMEETLAANFNIHPACFIPLAMVLLLSALKVPSILAMGSSAIVSVIVAVLTQGCSVSDVMASALSGYTSATGVEMVDTILTRGGITSMAGTVAIIFFSSIMAGALKSSGVLDLFVELLLKIVRGTASLVVTTLIFAWGIVMLTGNQMLGIIIPGKTMGDMYDKLDVDRKVLSRSLEDAATIGSAIIPWSSAAAYITGVLGIGIGYIPFALLCYIVPVFSVLCAMTGFGMWNAKGNAMWKKGKETSEKWNTAFQKK